MKVCVHVVKVCACCGGVCACCEGVHVVKVCKLWRCVSCGGGI